MKLKRALMIALVLSLTLCVFFVTASAATVVDSGKCGKNLTWTYDNEGTLTISGTGAMYDYYSQYNTNLEFSPWNMHSFNRIVVKSGVTTIGAGAFYTCSSSNVKTISLPNTLTAIGHCAFAYLDMEQIVIPNSVTSIGYYVFSECVNLKNVQLSNKLKTLAMGTFEGCTALEFVEIPESVTSIEGSAFAFCDSLSGVVFPSNLKFIGDYVFRDCDSLIAVSIPDSVTTIETSAFEDCSSLVAAYLPAGLKTINAYTFRFCSNLIEVFFPAALETIDNGAFSGCDSLSVIYYLGTEEQLSNLEVYKNNDPLYDAVVYFVTMITKQPQDVRTLAGEEVTFSTAASRKDVTYQWYYAESENDEWKPCKSASAKTAKLTFVAKATQNGYWYRCEITDPYGNKGSTQPAQLTIVKPVKITTQPKSVEVASGADAKVTVTATGEGLTYQWYMKNASATKFSKSSVTTKTYSAKMSSSVDGRQVYCVITDKFGNSVTSNTVTLTMKKGVTIVAQPKTTYTKSGSTAKVTVKAEGDGLSYQWYIRNASGTTYSKSSVTGATYSATMSSTVKDRRVYCVITDQYGNKVQTDTVILRMAATVTTQPKTTYTKSGATAKVTVKAAGDGLTYQWYIKNAGASSFSKSSVTGATYSATMNSKTKDRSVYCVVTDKYGNKVQTNTVIMRMAATVTTQPKTTYTKMGATAKVTVKAAGDGLTYQWYIRNASGTTYSKSSVTSSTYTVQMSSSVKDRRVYCVVKDQYGNTVQTNTVILRMAASVTTQPKSVTVAKGATAKVSVGAAGDGLTYTWYIKNAGGTSFSKSSVTGATYSCTMSAKTDGRQVYCVVTDKYGNTVKSNVVTLTMK